MLVIFNTGERLWLSKDCDNNILEAYNQARSKAGQYYGFRTKPYQGHISLQKESSGMIKATVKEPASLVLETFIPLHYFEGSFRMSRRFLKTESHVWQLFDLLRALFEFSDDFNLAIITHFVY